MEKKFEVKTKMLGPGPQDEKEVRILNRVVTWHDDGIGYEPDPRHPEIIIQQLGLEEATSVTTPGVKESAGEDEIAEEDKLEGSEATLYRAIVARINYLALDRPDIQFSAKEASRHMAAPRSGN